MADGHVHALYLHGHSVLHRLAPQVKIVGAFLIVIGIVVTPREAFWAFGVYVLAVIALAAIARIPPSFAARRMLIEVPFLLVALLLPILGGGPSIEVFGLSLSQAGLWDAWNILAKATLGLSIAVILGATTQMPELLVGLDGLRMPSIVTAIAGFMVRYIDVILSDWSRMRIAMASRAHDARWITQIGPIARTLGVMFVRTYERGERVYLAMRSRGYTGSMPASAIPTTPGSEWMLGGAVIASVWAVAALAVLTT
ncbi:MAG: cobalt ECF transporter T component CbiQ [Acidimicrobiia bacterium]|nr:cobalt ECF transporter T component CbiQ [Acidimicrobiia bacterium]